MAVHTLKSFRLVLFQGTIYLASHLILQPKMIRLIHKWSYCTYMRAFKDFETKWPRNQKTCKFWSLNYRLFSQFNILRLSCASHWLDPCSSKHCCQEWHPCCTCSVFRYPGIHLHGIWTTRSKSTTQCLHKVIKDATAIETHCVRLPSIAYYTHLFQKIIFLFLSGKIGGPFNNRYSRPDEVH